MTNFVSARIKFCWDLLHVFRFIGQLVCVCRGWSRYRHCVLESQVVNKTMTFFQIQSELGSGWQPQGQEHGWSCGGGQASSGGGGWWPSRPISPFVTAPPPLHCHTRVMVAAVNGDVIIHPLLKLDIADLCFSVVQWVGQHQCFRLPGLHMFQIQWNCHFYLSLLDFPEETFEQTQLTDDATAKERQIVMDYGLRFSLSLAEGPDQTRQTSSKTDLVQRSQTSIFAAGFSCCSLKLRQFHNMGAFHW